MTPSPGVLAVIRRAGSSVRGTEGEDEVLVLTGDLSRDAPWVVC